MQHKSSRMRADRLTVGQTFQPLFSLLAFFLRRLFSRLSFHTPIRPHPTGIRPVALPVSRPRRPRLLQGHSRKSPNRAGTAIKDLPPRLRLSDGTSSIRRKAAHIDMEKHGQSDKHGFRPPFRLAVLGSGQGSGQPSVIRVRRTSAHHTRAIRLRVLFSGNTREDGSSACQTSR
jgi:hypothetical protein